MTSYGSVSTPAAEEGKASTRIDDDGPQGFMEHAAPYVAEFVGTFLIVFTMGCCHICGDAMWNPTGVAFTVLVAVYSFGSVSGAHLNPAVTLALGFVGKFPWMQMLGYMIAQTAGGLVASLSYWAIFSQTVSLGPADKEPFGMLEVGMVELMYTFLLCFVMLNVVASSRNNKENDQNHFFAIAVGFVYIAGGYPSQKISGGIFNPAASLAMGLTAGLSRGIASQDLHWAVVYLLAQAAGAWLASLMFAIVRPEDFHLQYDGALEDFVVPLRSKLVSELIGTFIIVMTVGLNLVMISPAGPWSSAASYICLIYALGDVSGGHFNPAVTLAVVLSRRGVCSIALGQTYVLQQILGGALAGVVYSHFDILKHQHLPLGPKGDHDWGEVCMAEILFTALLAFVFLAVATSTLPPSTTKTNFYFGLAVGSCITIGGFAIGALSGGTLNPAVAVGRAVAQMISMAILNKTAQDWHKLLNCLWFGLFELIGGACAAIVFSLTHQKEYLKDGSNYPHIP